MPAPIRLGDVTSHGGKVTSAADQTDVMGRPLARVNDTCTCPIPGHKDCVIVEGDPNWTINGRQVALHDHKVSCGATLISSLENVFRD